MKLSICVITYNQALYIEKCLLSLLNQVTDFEYEIVIGDDESFDGTRDVILGIANKHPDKVRLLPFTKNVGMLKNFVRTLKACKSEYIAVCEGDDYWIDEHKLHKQVKFLDSNQDFGLTSSAIKCVDEHDIELLNNTYILPAQIMTLSRDELFWTLFHKNFIYTVTVCFRKSILIPALNRIEEKELSFPYDHWFWLQIAIHSKINVSFDELATYRIHQKGISRNESFFLERKGLLLIDVLKEYISAYKFHMRKVNALKILRFVFWVTVYSNYNIKIKTKGISLLVFNFHKLL